MLMVCHGRGRFVICVCYVTDADALPYAGMHASYADADALPYAGMHASYAGDAPNFLVE